MQGSRTFAKFPTRLPSSTKGGLSLTHFLPEMTFFEEGNSDAILVNTASNSWISQLKGAQIPVGKGKTAGVQTGHEDDRSGLGLQRDNQSVSAA